MTLRQLADLVIATVPPGRRWDAIEVNVTGLEYVQDFKTNHDSPFQLEFTTEGGNDAGDK